MKRKGLKRIVASVFAIVISASMLLGATFAYFTDSTSSSNNIIASGNLKVNAYWMEGTKNPETDVWTNFTNGAIFDNDKWEPGYVEAKHLKIENDGNLAFNYKLLIVPNGEYSTLADVIDVYYFTDATTLSARSDVSNGTLVGTLKDLIENEQGVASGALLPENFIVNNQAIEKAGSVVVTIALKMRENLGSEYQGLSIGADFNVNVIATQYVYENDTFGSDYDSEATYLNKDEEGAWLINNIDELFYFSSEVNSGNSYLGETVKLNADIDLSGHNWIPIGKGESNGKWIGFNGIFDGQNHVISNVRINKDGGWNGIFGLVGRGTTKVNESISNLTVKNVVIEETNRMTGAIVGQIYGNVENCHVENVIINAIPNKVANGYDNGDKIGGIVGWLGDNGDNHYAKNCSAKNVTLKAYRDVAGIVGYIGSSTTVENCSVDTVNITVDQITNYYGDKDANAGGVVGRIYKQPVTVQNNTESKVNIGNVAVANSDTQLDSAIKDGASTVILGSGEYQMPDSAKNQDITISGNGNTTVNVVDDGASEGDIDYSLEGANVTFENLTLNIKGSNYPGYAHVKSATYNNCTIKGSNYALYGKSVFNNCTFDLNNGYVWTWGAPEVEFNNCTFNDTTSGAAKAILVHNTIETKVIVKDCTFIATTPKNTWDGIPVAAVSIDPENGSPDATVYFVGNNTYSDAFNGLYQVKYADEVDDVKVYVNGESVVVPVGKN